MNIGKDKISRRQWIKSAMIAAASPVIVSTLASCRRASEIMPMSAVSSNGSWPDAEKTISSLPEKIGCISCDRCMPCGYGVDIPAMFRIYNEALEDGLIPVSVEDIDTPSGIARASAFLSNAEKTIGDRHLAHRCVGCGHCLPQCPKGIKIVGNMRAIGSLIDLIRERQCL